MFLFQKKKKAIGLFSGGLDSVVAAKLIADQGVSVTLLTFLSPFFSDKTESIASLGAKELGLKIKFVNLGTEHLKMIQKPRFGYGSALNPCLDCHIFMLRKAKELMNKLRADFVFTGEVLGQRPMSQKRSDLILIAQETGLRDLILRPLSALLLPLTRPEKKGWVDREKLLGIEGRSRKKQLSLAQEHGLQVYSSPAGGCLLTEKEFAQKLKILWQKWPTITPREISLIKFGRFFETLDGIIMVGRNQEENKNLMKLKSSVDYFFNCPDWPSPTTILVGPKKKDYIRRAASLTARYSDAPADKKVFVEYGNKKQGLKRIEIKKAIFSPNRKNGPESF
ncbi:tRNA 4-thiouridine(8) synthase ThiI [Patescibacteria group bacterium]|nr:tRNA 4-thiouridine(8) synthase ThiI [Patescibacteria group bacterium]